MIYRVLGLTLTGLLLSACTTTTPEREDGFLAELPEGLAEAAAPGQNLGSVRVLPEDGCYWYEHTGPVETTLLPLRSPDGRQICTRPSGESA